jgi:hypothetical protein
MHHGAWGTEAGILSRFPFLVPLYQGLDEFPEVKFEARIMHLLAAISPIGANAARDRA